MAIETLSSWTPVFRSASNKCFVLVSLQTAARSVNECASEEHDLPFHNFAHTSQKSYLTACLSAQFASVGRMFEHNSHSNTTFFGGGVGGGGY